MNEGKIKAEVRFWNYLFFGKKSVFKRYLKIPYSHLHLNILFCRLVTSTADASNDNTIGGNTEKKGKGFFYFTDIVAGLDDSMFLLF